MSLVRVKREDLKRLSEADRERLRKLADKPVDCSDIPELSDDWFDRAQRAVLLKVRKTKVAK